MATEYTLAVTQEDIDKGQSLKRDQEGRMPWRHLSCPLALAGRRVIPRFHGVADCFIINPPDEDMAKGGDRILIPLTPELHAFRNASDNDMRRLRSLAYDSKIPPPQPATFKVIAPW